MITVHFISEKYLFSNYRLSNRTKIDRMTLFTVRVTLFTVIQCHKQCDSFQNAQSYIDILVKPKPSTKSNLTNPMQKALISLQRKKKDVKILPVDKGNATVILSKQQYEHKIQEHLSLPAYKKLDKDPTDSIKRKLDIIINTRRTKGTHYVSGAPLFY